MHMKDKTYWRRKVYCRKCYNDYTQTFSDDIDKVPVMQRYKIGAYCECGHSLTVEWSEIEKKVFYNLINGLYYEH